MSVKSIGDKLIFHPSYYIKEDMEYKSLTEDEYIKKYNFDAEEFIGVLHHNKAVTDALAAKLEEATGGSKQLWLNMQDKWDKEIIRLEDNDD